MKLSLGTKLRLSRIRSVCNNENGAVLVIGLMFLAILALLGSTAVVLTTTDMQIGGNYKTSVQAFNVAQAGVSEALYRLGLFDDHDAITPPQAPPSGSMININGLTDNNAAISIDPNGLLTNGSNDDNDFDAAGNAIVDEIDELNSNSSQGVIAYDNRNWQAKIMLSSSAPAGLVSNITFFTNTIQPSGTWMEYSSPPPDDGTALTIEFLKNTGNMYGGGDTSNIVFYNESLPTPFNVDETSIGGDPASGQPVVVITSTGKEGGSISKIQVAAVHQPLDILAEGALMVNQLPTFGGSPVVSGFNYDGTVSHADDCSPVCPDDNRFVGNGADNHGGPESIDDLPKVGDCAGCAGYPAGKINYQDDDIDFLACSEIDPTTCAASDNEEEKDAETKIPYQSKLESSGHKPGVWSTVTAVDPTTGDIWGGDLAGTTSWKKDPVGGLTWMTLAQMLQITQAQLDKILASANVTKADMVSSSGKLEVAPQGVIYIDNAGGTELDIAAGTPSKEDGWGLMYVTGDLKISSALFQFKGLIYVEGDVHCSGAPLIIGCLAVKGNAPGAAFPSGSPHIIYSADALTQYVNKSMKFVTLSWKDEGVN